MEQGIRESRFNYNGQTDPSVANTWSYTSILSQSTYEFMTNAFYGTGGYRDGNYLVPFRREMFYLQRKGLAYYKNFVKPICRAMVEPVFSEAITRTVQDDSGNDINDSMYQDFTKDCDNSGRPLQAFMEDVVYTTRLHGCSFIVMDNFGVEEMPPSLSEARKNRIFPYVYLRTASMVEAYELDKWGRLQSIIFHEQPEKVTMKEVNGKKEYKTEERYRRWTTEEVQLLAKTKMGNYEAIQSYSHGLGRVTVIPVYAVSRVNTSHLLSDPPLFDIARVNHGIFNLDSELRALQRAQAFSTLYIPGDSPSDVTLSENNVLWIPTNSPFPPAYISPDVSIMTGLLTTMQDMVEQIYRLAEQNGVVGVKEAKSGVAKQWDFVALEGVLKKSAQIAIYGEIQIADLFRLYTNEQINVIPDYPTDFGPVSVADEIDVYDKLSGKVKSKKFQAEIERKQAKLMLNDIPREDLDEILDDITEAYAAKEDPVPPPFMAPGVTGMQPVTETNEDEEDEDEDE